MGWWAAVSARMPFSQRVHAAPLLHHLAPPKNPVARPLTGPTNPATGTPGRLVVGLVGPRRPTGWVLRASPFPPRSWLPRGHSIAPKWPIFTGHKGTTRRAPGGHRARFGDPMGPLSGAVTRDAGRGAFQFRRVLPRALSSGII